MRTFKTICHNNIHRDYTDELIKNDSKKDRLTILWRDTRPTYVGEVKILSSGDVIGNFDIIDLVLNKEYELQISGHQVYILIDNKPCVIVCGRNNDPMSTTIMGLSDGFALDALEYDEFFYSEGQMRDNKLNDILGI